MSNPIKARKRPDERKFRRNLFPVSAELRLGHDRICRELSQLWRAIVAKFIPIIKV